MPVQQPVHIPIGMSPTRVASGWAAPFLIVNLSSEDTVWLADNPGVQVNQGTPIFPGANLEWTKETGEVWGVCDGGECVVVVTSDVVSVEPDPIATAVAILNSGLILVDQPVVIFDDILDPNENTGILDVSRYQSVLVQAGPFGTTPTFADVHDLRVETGMIGVSGASIVRTFSWINGSYIRFSMPVLGSDFFISNQESSPGSRFEVRIIASHRAWPMMQQWGTLVGQHFIQDAQVSVLTATTLTLDSMVPYIGEVMVRVSAASGSVPSGTNVTVIVPGIGTVAIAPLGVAQPPSTIVSVAIPISMVGRAFRLTIQNNTGGTRNYNYSVDPVIYAGGIV